MPLPDLGPIALELAVLATALLVFVADLLLPADEKRGLGALTVLGLGGILVASCFWVRPEGVTFFGTYVSDGVGLYFKQVLLLAGVLGALGSIDHVDRHFPARQGEHYLLMLCSLVGMMLLTGARDLLLWVVAFELAGIPLIVLAGLQKDRRGTEAALKLFLTSATSSVFTLYGFSMLWGLSGATSFAEMANMGVGPLQSLALAMVLGGVAFKLGVVPFHLWMADTYQGAPAPTVGFLSVAPKIAVFAGLIRFLLEGLLPLQAIWGAALVLLATLTLVQGNLSALAQTDSRRLLALSGVAHMGLMLMALAVGTAEAVGILCFYALAYAFTNMGAFLVVSVVSEAQGDASISAYTGLGRRSPALALAMLLFLLSLGGIPFVAGFWAKVLLLWTAWQGGLMVLVVLAVLLAVLALFYYLKIARAMYITEQGPDTVPVVGRATASAIGLCVAGVVLLGVLPGPFLEQAMSAARALGL
jgi:NADH-quinone oxidoreductase subunit N